MFEGKVSDQVADLIRKCLRYDPLERIQIKDVEQHAFLTTQPLTYTGKAQKHENPLVMNSNPYFNSGQQYQVDNFENNEQELQRELEENVQAFINKGGM